MPLPSYLALLALGCTDLFTDWPAQSLAVLKQLQSEHEAGPGPCTEHFPFSTHLLYLLPAQQRQVNLQHGIGGHVWGAALSTKAVCKKKEVDSLNEALNQCNRDAASCEKEQRSGGRAPQAISSFRRELTTPA